jgi:hypothetical protein
MSPTSSRAAPATDGKHYAIDFTLAEIKTLEKLGREGRVRMYGHTDGRRSMR